MCHCYSKTIVPNLTSQAPGLWNRDRHEAAVRERLIDIQEIKIMSRFNRSSRLAALSTCITGANMQGDTFCVSASLELIRIFIRPLPRPQPPASHHHYFRSYHSRVSYKVWGEDNQCIITNMNLTHVLKNRCVYMTLEKDVTYQTCDGRIPLEWSWDKKQRGFGEAYFVFAKVLLRLDWGKEEVTEVSTRYRVVVRNIQ